MDIFWGKVKKGAQRGKTLGFPTANIALHKEIAEGIYVSKVKIQTKAYPALTFIGKSETFGEKIIKAESFLLDFSGDIYGKYITVYLLKKIRENKKFALPEDLVKQMQHDLLVAKTFFALHKL